MEKQSAKREQLMHTGVIELSYCFEDIYHSAPKEFQKAVDLMTDEELGKFIDENLSHWEDGVQAGLCTDQEVVLSTCAIGSENMPAVFGKGVLDKARRGEHPCFICTDAVGPSVPCKVYDNCVAIAAYTDFVTSKQMAFDLLMEKKIYRNHIHGYCECDSEKKCIAGSYLANEISPDEVVRLLTADNETVKSEELS